MTAAVIDLGTNTFHLIIAQISTDEVKVIYKTNIPVKLGEGRINDNIIIPEAYERGLLALETFNSEIKKHKADVVKAIATSAIRSAANGDDFIKAAKSLTGIEIEAVSGDEEAGYIYSGIKATGAIDGSSLIIDIGGGSTEFIICDAQGPLWKKSYNIGAARLMQAYFNSDPISAADKQAITLHLKTELNDLKDVCNTYRPKHLIGSAGAFETFAGMIDPRLDLSAIAYTAIDLHAYRGLSEKLIASTHQERAAMPDLVPLRVDMIVIAAILTDDVIDLSGIDRISLSTYDLKMGVLHSLQQSEID